MLTSVTIFAVCRLLGVRMDEAKEIDYASFVFEGGKFDLQLDRGKVKNSDVGHIFSFQLRCETSVLSVAGKDGRAFQVLQFRPLKGVPPFDFKRVE